MASKAAWCLSAVAIASWCFLLHFDMVRSSMYVSLNWVKSAIWDAWRLRALPDSPCLFVRIHSFLGVHASLENNDENKQLPIKKKKNTVCRAFL